MVYAPGRFLFVHIPRTSGMSITAAIARQLPAFTTVLIATANSPSPWVRHARAVELQPHIPDWNRIFKFAIDRPLDEIVASDYRLHQQDASANEEVKTRFLPEWRANVEALQSLSLDQFRVVRWEKWLGSQAPWAFWCCDEAGQEMGIERFEYAKLHRDWTRITESIGLGEIELPHLTNHH